MKGESPMVIGLLCVLTVLLSSTAVSSNYNHHHDGRWHPEHDDVSEGLRLSELNKRSRVKADSRPNIILFFCDDVSGI